MQLTFDELREASILRNTGSFDGSFSWSLNDWLVAISGEVGEACNAAKKLRRDDASNVAALEEEVAKELADVVIYIDLLFSQHLNARLEHYIQDKFNEVSKRVGSNITL